MRRLILALVLLGLSACHHTYHAQYNRSRSYRISADSLDTDSSIVAMLAPYKLGVDTQMHVVVGHTDVPLIKAQPECAMGNFIADAQLAAALKIDSQVVASVMNYGGMRLPYIAAGAIIRGKMYELMPFDNMLTIIEISGAGIKQFCSHIAKANGWPVSGLQFTIKENEATDILLNGHKLDDSAWYRIAISDYLANGGDYCDFLKPLKRRVTSVFIRDAMIDYVAALEAQGKLLHPQIEGRVKYAE